jgi:HEAT repeat protein
MLGTLTSAALGLLAGAAAVCLAIAGVRATRTLAARRRSALAAGPRRRLLAFVADSGDSGDSGAESAEGAEDLVALPAAAWRAAEPTAVALLGKVRGDAHRALAGVFERRGAVDAALRDLRAHSRVRRARAAETLGNLGRRDAVPGLCDLLGDPHAEVRVVAVRALGRIADPAAAPDLIAVLAAPQPAPSQLVAHALIQLGPAAEPALVTALRHRSPLVRVTALDALGLAGAAGATAAVAELLATDGAVDVRVAAAATLGKLGTRGALDPLLAALGRDQPTVLRAAAARALGELGAAAAVEPLDRLLADEPYRVAHEAAQALRRLGPAGLPALKRRADQPVEGESAAHAREALAMAGVAPGAPVEAPKTAQTLAVAG